MNKLLVLLIFSVQCSTARYQVHDPNSFCKQRKPELQLRPAITCENSSDSSEPKCNYAVTVNLHWKCKNWSSW